MSPESHQPSSRNWALRWPASRRWVSTDFLRRSTRPEPGDLNEKHRENKSSTKNTGVDQAKGMNFKETYGFVWKCWVNIPNEIAI